MNTTLNKNNKRYKYPSTPYLPYSPTVDDGDLIFSGNFVREEVIVTEKRDGENTTIYPDYYLHSRSVDGQHHPTRNWVKNLCGKIAHKIPEGHRICGENLFAKHTIEYDNLETYFEVFNIWKGDECLSWEETKVLCDRLDLKHVPILFEGKWSSEYKKEIINSIDEKGQEGFVIRKKNRFKKQNFENNIAKYVTKDFKQKLQESDVHWRYDIIEKNNLKKDG